jgi:hypothetical protein
MKNLFCTWLRRNEYDAMESFASHLLHPLENGCGTVTKYFSNSIQVDSLKYLGKCTIAYGVDAVSSHTTAIWDSLKNEILTAARPLSIAVASDGFADNAVVEEALTCLTECVLACHKGKDTGVLLELLLQDEKLEGIIRFVISDVSAKVVPSKTELGLQVQALGRLLSAAAKSSLASCFIVSQRFLPQLLDAMGVPLDQGPGPDYASNDMSTANCFVTVGALYICDQIVQANRILAEGLVSQPHVRLDPSSGSSSLSLLRHLANPLTIAFVSAIPTHNGSDCQKSLLTTKNEIMHLGGINLSFFIFSCQNVSPFMHTCTNCFINHSYEFFFQAFKVRSISLYLVCV